MILIYYKNAAGKVCRLYRPPKGWTREDLVSDLILHAGNICR